MRRFALIIFLLLLSGCTSSSILTATLAPTAIPLAALPEGCASPGQIIRAELAKPARGYPYSYRVYLPPCFSAQGGTQYPVLYLIPGRSSSPDTWFAAGVTEVVDRLILKQEIPPFLIVTTENIDSDPEVKTIHEELIPTVEGEYPIIKDRRYRAVAGGSLGGIAAYRLAFHFPDGFSSAGIFGAGAISGEEEQIHNWLSSMTESNRIRVFMDTGDEDILMLDRARVMKSILDEAGVENELHTGHGAHNYAYWVGNFEMYLKWMTENW